MDPEELLQRANEGDMVAQYELAEHYGKLLKQTDDETEIYQYSLDAMLWLKRSAQQGYAPAMEAMSELEVRRTSEPPAPADPPAGEEGEMEADDATVAAVTAAVLESASEVADAHRAEAPAVQPPEAEEWEPEEETSGGGIFSSGTNTALFIMLVISLLLNALLLFFLFRMSRDSRSLPPQPTPAPVAEVTPTPTQRPTPTAVPTAEPTPSSTPEPSPEPTPEPTPEPFWLDLSKYPKLELKPSEDKLFEEYKYYIVTASSTLNMRSGPDTRYERITTIPSLAKVGAVSQYGSWMLVEFGGEMGWVHANYLTDDLNYGKNHSSSGNLSTY